MFCGWVETHPISIHHTILTLILPVYQKYNRYICCWYDYYNNYYYIFNYYIYSLLLYSTYPLGGYITAMLLLSTAAALATTIYATTSCRFVVLTFTSQDGNNFEEYFQANTIRTSGSSTSTTTTDGTAAKAVYRASVGLYQWLRPLDNTDSSSSSMTTTTTSTTKNTAITDWTVGACVGYQQTMLAAIEQSQNIFFDLSRVMAIFAILIGIFQFSWMFLSSCMSMNRLQLYLFILLSVCGTTFTGLTFLFFKSTVCTTEFDHSVYCQIDQGGLVMIAAIVFWTITLLISIYYVVPVVMVVSSKDSIDFELHKTRTIEEKEKLALQREVYKHLRRQQKEQRQQREDAKIRNETQRELPTYISPTQNQATKESIPSQHVQERQAQATIRNSYSYDSKESWLRPIPKRKHVYQSNHLRSMSLDNNDSTILVPTSLSASNVEQHHHQQQQQQKSSSNLSRSFLRLASPSSYVQPPRRVEAISNVANPTTKTSSSSKVVSVQPQETGDIEVQDELALLPSSSSATRTKTSSKTLTVVATDQPIEVPLERRSSSHDERNTATTTTAVTTEVQQQPLSAPASHDANTSVAQQQEQQQQQPAVVMSTSSNLPRKKNPLERYIAQRLDSIEQQLT
jgi:hypothetical protein